MIMMMIVDKKVSFEPSFAFVPKKILQPRFCQLIKQLPSQSSKLCFLFLFSFLFAIACLCEKGETSRRGHDDDDDEDSEGDETKLDICSFMFNKRLALEIRALSNINDWNRDEMYEYTQIKHNCFSSKNPYLQN